MGKIGNDGQEYIENLEVLLGRMLFRLEEPMQNAVDALIKQTYINAKNYYEKKGLTGYDLNNNPPPVIGIHIRSEYVLLMNPKDCPGKKIEKCVKPYTWFESCGISTLNKELLNGVEPYLFIAADTKQAQQAANIIFNSERVYFRPFDKTGGSFKGIQEAIIDLISVSSFDAFVGTPHSSYSEMSSILSQPRRVFIEGDDKYKFIWNWDQQYEYKIPVNRMIIPVMTNVGWEIDKLNLYTMGRVVNVDIDDNDKILLPQQQDSDINFQSHRICKQQITAGMGWMGLFQMFKSVNCYNKDWHHPGQKWFPIANK